MNSTALSPPPLDFKFVEKILWAELSPVGPPVRRDWYPKGSAKLAGISYERKVHAYLRTRYPLNYGPMQWIRYIEAGCNRTLWRQPDGLYLDLHRGLIIIVEVKLKHVTESWWKMRYVYEPLVRHIFGPDFKYAIVEVCRWRDANIQWPEPSVRVTDLSLMQPREAGIHVWEGTGRRCWRPEQLQQTLSLP